MFYFSVRIRQYLIAAFSALAFSVCTLNADVLVLKSGDRLTGKLISKDGGKIVFEHPQLGQLTVAGDQASVEVAAAQQEASAQQAVADAENAAEQPAQAAVAQAAPAAEASPEPPKDKNFMEKTRDSIKSWMPKGMEGKISVGYTHIDTGDTSESLALALDITYTKDLWKYGFRAFYDYATSETEAGVKSTSSDKYGAAVSAAREIGPRWFLESKTTYDHDELLELEHQVQENLSVGYWIIKKDKLTWNVTLGPAVRYTDARGSNEHWYGLAAVQENLMYKFNDTLRIDHYANYNIDPTDANKYSWKLYVGFTAKVSEWIDATLSYEHSVNKMVGDDAQTNEDRIIFALGIPF